MKLLLTLLFVVSCAHIPSPTPNDVVIESNAPVEIAKPVVVPQPVIVPVVLPVRVKVNVISLKGFSEARAARFRKIAANVEELINSKEFETGVREFTYLNKKAFIDNNGHSNDKVFENITKSEWTLEYKLESMRSSTVGYTYPDVTWIAINSGKFDKILDDADIAGNIVHEFGGHKLGRYGHAKSWSKSRDHSVPYGVGYLVEKLYRKNFME